MSNSNFLSAISFIEISADSLPIDSEVRRNVLNVKSMAESGYVLVTWPESQDFMEEDWFEDEAIFCGGSEDITGSSAYFIPISKLI